MSLLILGASATGAAGSSLGLGSDSSAQVDAVVVTAGETPLTSVEPGRPAIDFSQGAAHGIAPNSRVVIGDRERPWDDHAFALHNEGEELTQIAIRYSYNRQPSESAGVYFSVLGSDGLTLAEAPGVEGAVFDLPAGETAYVVVVIDTTGTTPSDDLSGTIEFITS